MIWLAFVALYGMLLTAFVVLVLHGHYFAAAIPALALFCVTVKDSKREVKP